jgi:membrane-bound metal-dependent hydrolase YbcI (DUF457 family)
MAVFAVVGVIPDFDLLAAVHRGPTHSLTAAAIAGVAAWMWCAAGPAWRRRVTGQEVRRRSNALRLALAVSAAYATHTLLDWLGADTSSPIGIMALWPASRGYYESQRHVFLAISRRYWLPDFWTLNLHAVARELAILGPLAAVVVWLRTRKQKAES